MDRRHRIYERLLAEMQRGTESKKGNHRNRNRRTNVARGQQEKLAQEREDNQYNFNFPNELMTKRKLAKKTGVPYRTIVEFIADGILKPIRLPCYKYDKFSPAQLERLIKNYNKLY